MSDRLLVSMGRDEVMTLRKVATSYDRKLDEFHPILTRLDTTLETDRKAQIERVAKIIDPRPFLARYDGIASESRNKATRKARAVLDLLEGGQE